MKSQVLLFLSSATSDPSSTIVSAFKTLVSVWTHPVFPFPLENILSLMVLLAALVLHWLWSSKAWQNGVLIAFASLVLLRMSLPFLVLVFVSSLLEWGLSTVIRRSERAGFRRFLLLVGLSATFLELYLFHLPLIVPDFLAKLEALGVPAWLSGAFGVGWPLLWALQKSNLSLDAYDRPGSRNPGLFDSLVYCTFFTNMAFGPMEPLGSLLPQIESKRRFTDIQWEQAGWHFLMGIFKLRFIMGLPIFQDGMPGSAWGLFPNMILSLGFSWALLSGVNNLTKGTAFLFGIETTDNFLAPFFAKDVADFWRRWNVSVYRWIYEVVFSRLAFTLRNWGKAGIVIACYATFLASGVLHGPKPGYLVWGFLHGSAMSLFLLTRRKSRRSKNGPKPSPWRVIPGGLLTFLFVSFASLFETEMGFAEILPKFQAFLQYIWIVPQAATAAGSLWSGTVLVCFAGSIMALQWMAYRADTPLWMLRWKPSAKIALAAFFLLTIAGDGLVFRSIY